MKLINLTKHELNLPVKGLSHISPNTISRNAIMTRDVIKSYLVTLANIHQHKIIVVVDENERYGFNDIFSVYPLLNLRNYSDIIEYNKGDEIPTGSSIITDPNYIDPITGKVTSKEFLVLPNTVIADSKPGWEDPANPGVSNGNVRFFLLTWDEYQGILNKNQNAIYFIYDKRYIAQGDKLFTATKDSDDLKSVLQLVLTDLGMTDTTIPTSKAVVDYINHRFETAISGVEYRGLVDANNPSENTYWIDSLHGYMYRVSVAGIIDGIELGVGDTIIINKDVTGAPTSADMDIIPYTLDEIGDLRLLETKDNKNIVSAINEVNSIVPRWDGIEIDQENALFKPKYLSTEDIENTPIIPGQYIVDSLTGAEYIDLPGGVRALKERIIDTTYAELLEYKNTEKLVPGRVYRITDYQTIYKINDTVFGREDDEVRNGFKTEIEPLLVRAINSSSIDENSAMSEKYPSDVIYYTLDNSLFEYLSQQYSKGIIFYRKDTIKNIEAWEDWRSIRYPTRVYTASSATSYAEVSSFRMGHLLKGNGVVGSVDSIFALGKNKNPNYALNRRELDVFETNLTQFLNKRMVMSSELPSYPLFINTDPNKQVVESVNSDSLKITDFDTNTEIFHYMFSSTDPEVVGLNIENYQNVSVTKVDIKKLSNVVIFGEVQDSILNLQNTTIAGTIFYSTIKNNNSLIEGFIGNSKIIAENSSIKADISNSNLEIINSLVNLNNIMYSNINVFNSYLGRFISANSLEQYDDILGEFLGITAKLINESKVCSAKNCSINNIFKSSLNTTLGGIINVFEEVHINCPKFSVNNICTVNRFDFTNPNQSLGNTGVGIEFLNLTDNKEIGDYSEFYNSLVTEKKYKLPKIVTWTDSMGTGDSYLQYMNEALMIENERTYDKRKQFDLPVIK